MLRTYGELGLLTPVAVDSLSGYRYYSPEQLPRAVIIAAMRRAGIPLAEIAKFFRQPDPDQVAYHRATTPAAAPLKPSM